MYLMYLHPLPFPTFQIQGELLTSLCLAYPPLVSLVPISAQAGKKEIIGCPITVSPITTLTIPAIIWSHDGLEATKG